MENKRDWDFHHTGFGKKKYYEKKFCVKNLVFRERNDLAWGFFVGFISDDNRSIINDLLVSSRS